MAYAQTPKRRRRVQAHDTYRVRPGQNAVPRGSTACTSIAVLASAYFLAGDEDHVPFETLDWSKCVRRGVQMWTIWFDQQTVLPKERMQFIRDVTLPLVQIDKEYYGRVAEFTSRDEPEDGVHFLLGDALSHEQERAAIVIHVRDMAVCVFKDTFNTWWLFDSHGDVAELHMILSLDALLMMLRDRFLLEPTDEFSAASFLLVN